MEQTHSKRLLRNLKGSPRILRLVALSRPMMPTGYPVHGTHVILLHFFLMQLPIRVTFSAARLDLSCHPRLKLW